MDATLETTVDVLILRKKALERYLDELIRAKQMGHRYTDNGSIDGDIVEIERQIADLEDLKIEYR